jgi:hypothetical protein
MRYLSRVLTVGTTLAMAAALMANEAAAQQTYTHSDTRTWSVYHTPIPQGFHMYVQRTEVRYVGNPPMPQPVVVSYGDTELDYQGVQNGNHIWTGSVSGLPAIPHSTLRSSGPIRMGRFSWMPRM